MKTINCPQCESLALRSSFQFESSRRDLRSGQPIVIEDALLYKCSNPQCGFEWMPSHEEERINSIIMKRSKARLDPHQIKTLREALCFRTKSQAADFLMLNSKAFSRWETGSDEISDAYDLLLRLVARSHDNLEFVKSLHKKNFKFEIDDYQVLSNQPAKVFVVTGTYSGTYTGTYASGTPIYDTETEKPWEWYPRLEGADLIKGNTNVAKAG